MMKQMKGRFDQYPMGYANWGRLMLMQLNPYYEVVVLGPSATATRDLLIRIISHMPCLWAARYQYPAPISEPL